MNNAACRHAFDRQGRIKAVGQHKNGCPEGIQSQLTVQSR